MRTMLLSFAGAAALLMADHMATVQGWSVAGVGQSAPGAAAQVDRSAKGDRLPASAGAGSEHTIATVEVVGLQETAIIYRDRAGRVLFQTDPVGNATVIVRGVSLPQVTIRQTQAAQVHPVVLDNARPTATETPKPPSQEKPQPVGGNPKLPDGCEAAVSPLAGAAAASMPARCMAEAASPTKLASLR
jgi:hypothetical protein